MRYLEPKQLSEYQKAASSKSRLPGSIRGLYALFALGTVFFALFYVIQLSRQDRLEPLVGHRFSVSLEEPNASGDEPPPRGVDRSSLRIAIAPVISPEKSIEIYRDLARYIAAQLEREAVVLQRATYAEINELVRSRQCDVALVCTYPFVRGEQDFGMEALVVPQIKGVLTYHSLILISKSSQAGSLLDLRGKRFACADFMSNSGWLYPALWLQNQGEDPDSFFSEVVVAGSHDRSIQAVFSGYVDGAAVDSLVYETIAEENPSIGTRIRIIHKSPPFGMPPIVVHPQMFPGLKSQLREALLNMGGDPEGAKILSPLGIEKFVVADDAIYDSVRKAARLWESRQ